GSVVDIPKIEGLNRKAIWTSEDVYTSTELPDSVIVLGGGPVGCETAQMLARFGSKVTIVQSAPRLIPEEERTVAGALADVFRRDGIDVRLDSKVVRAELRGDYRAIPRGVYTDPAVACVGLSSHKATERGHDVVTSSMEVRHTARADATGLKAGWLVLLADRRPRTLIGAAAIGPHAEEW